MELLVFFPSFMVYLLFIVGGLFFTWLGVDISKRIIGYESFAIPTPSMEPSIKIGDKLMAIKINPQEVKIGDVITFIKSDGVSYIGRVLALPNQQISILEDQVEYKGGKEEWKKSIKTESDLFEYQEYESLLPNRRKFKTQKIEKVQGMDFPQQESSNMETLQIQEGHVFVIGDNRNNSIDSRMYGAVPFEMISKKVSYIWWSKDLDRIGTSLD